jgi:hypothetical protein
MLIYSALGGKTLACRAVQILLGFDKIGLKFKRFFELPDRFRSATNEIPRNASLLPFYYSVE